MATLLDSLTKHQQHLVEVVAQAFVAESGKWPIFDYVEGTLDTERVDAWDVMESFPRLAGMYAAIWWPRSPGTKPPPDTEVALTILGIHHCRVLKSLQVPLVETFFALLGYLGERRRAQPLSRTQARQLEVTGDEAVGALSERGFRADLLPSRLLYDLMEHEPPLWAMGGSLDADGITWRRGVPREVLDFEDVESIEVYAERVGSLLMQPVPAPQMATPSPLGLVAAIDYLDTVWRLVPGHKSRLFDLHSAQRAAKLAFPAHTADEFDSRLSALGEILKSAKVAKHESTEGRKPRDTPLAELERYLVARLPTSETRVARAIATLRNIITVRDAGQHSAAGRRGASALAQLGIAYPPADWAAAWEALMARAIEALDALREELSALVQ